MPPPVPLTQCDPPRLDWSRPGTPAATNFGDIYFSTDGGLEETETVFLGGCGLPEGWQNCERFVIGELGFGSGLNFLAAWRLWDKTKSPASRLHFISIEKFPFDAQQLGKALAAWPRLKPYSDKLIAAWPGRVKGFHRLHFDGVTLTLIHDDITPALDALEASVDAWFLDGFSPAKNPDMWSETIMQKLATLSAPGARLATFTVAGAVRSALQKAGFETDKKTGFGRKRHRLEARFPGSRKTVKPSMTPAIIGAGISGASLFKAFERRGISAKVFHDPNHIAASHNAAALIKPRLDLQDRPESRFFLASYLYALQAYDAYTLMKGISHVPKTDIETTRFHKLSQQAPLPSSHLTMDGNVMLLQKSLVIKPKTVLIDWLKDDLFTGDDWTNGPLTILAAGYGLKSLLKSNNLGLRYSRGQLTWAEVNTDIKSPITYGGYALPLKDGTLLGATHDRVTMSAPFEPRDEDDLKNIEAAKTYTSTALTKSEKPSRASIRVTTANTLPLVTHIDDGRWLFTGMGSRGFVFAPLLAEALVSKICGDPLPVSKQLWARFSEREKPNRKTRPS